MPPKDKQGAPVTAADVAPLTGAPAPATAPAPARIKPFLSEGMRHDLETLGWTVDPVSGARFDLNRETGEVTVTEKDAANPITGEPTAGAVSTIDVPITIPATAVDPATGTTTVTDPETGKVTVTDAEGNVTETK